MGNTLRTASNQEPLLRQDHQPLTSEDLVVETRSHEIDMEGVGEHQQLGDQQPQVPTHGRNGDQPIEGVRERLTHGGNRDQPIEDVHGDEQVHGSGDGDQPIEVVRGDENPQVTQNIIISLWEKLVDHLFTPVQSNGNDVEDNPVSQQQVDDQAQSKQDSEEIVSSIPPGLRINIDEVKDLLALADLVKQKIELEKYIEAVFKSGREARKDIIITIAGTLLLGMLNVIIEGLLADHIPFEMRMIVLGIFTITSIIFLVGAIYEQHHIYEPALTDALSTHSTMILGMNVHRNALMVEESKPRKEGLSMEAEAQLQQLMSDYCTIIIRPLPIHQERTTSFILVGCVIVVLVFACVLRALSLSRSPAPAPVPSPPPHSGPF